MGTSVDGSFLREYEASILKAEVVEDPYQTLLTFPEDSVNVSTAPHHAILRSTPKLQETSSKYFADSVRAVCDPFLFVEKKYQPTEQPRYFNPPDVDTDKKYENWIAHDQIRREETISVQDVDGLSIVSVDDSSYASIRPRSGTSPPSYKVIDDYPNHPIISEEDSKIRLDFMKAHRGVDKMDWGDLRSIKDKNSFRDRLESKIVISCKTITIKPMDVQPFFLNLSVYDLPSKTKITENFYFHQNSTALMGMLGEMKKSSLDSIFWSNTPNTAVVALPHSPHGLYVIIRVEKVLQGDYESCVEPYTKDGASASEKLKRESKENCLRMGEYRQPFGWAVMPLFNEESPDSKHETISENSKELPIFKYRSDDMSDNAILESIADKASKKKQLSGTLTITVSKFGESSDIKKYCFIDPSAALMEYPESMSANGFENLIEGSLKPNQVAIELQPFSGRGTGVPTTPYNRFINNLYIYPEQLNFLQMTNKSCQVRNLLVTVSCKADDSNLDEDGLAVFYSRNGVSRTTKVNSQIIYHQKVPLLYDEIKLELPTQIDSSRHLLFKFYHVSCKTSGKGNAQKPEITFVGYSFIKLFTHLEHSNTLRMRDDAIHTIPVYPVPPTTSRYMKYAEETKPESRATFKLRTRAVSSLFPQEDITVGLLTLYESPSTDVLHRIVDSLYKHEKGKDLHEAFRFLPWVLNTLLKLILHPNQEIATDSFRAIYRLISRISPDTEELNPWILSYVKYLFNPDFDRAQFCERLLSIWNTSGLQTANTERKHLFDENTTNFLLSVLTKTMTVDLHARGLLKNSKQWGDRFQPTLVQLISKVVVKLAERCLSKTSERGDDSSINRSLGFFLKDMLSVIDRGAVLQMIYQVLKCYNSFPKADLAWRLRIELCRIVMDHEHFVPLSLPVAVRIESIPNMLEQFERKHFLAGILMMEVKQSFQASKYLKYEVIKTLVWILVKLESDPRYQGSAERSRIAALFFPFLSFIVDKVPELWRISQSNRQQNSSDESREIDNAKEYYRNILLCFSWILKNVHQGILKEWWNQENTLTLIEFLGLLDTCIEQFSSELESLHQMSIRRSQGSTRGQKDRSVSMGASDSIRKYRASTLRGKHDEKQLSDVKSEHVICTEIRLVILEILDEFSLLFGKDLMNPNISQQISGPFLDPLLRMLDVEQSRSAHQSALLFLNKLLLSYPRLFFVFKNQFVNRITRLLILLSCSADQIVSNLACSTLYCLIKINYEETGQIYRSKFHITENLSDLAALKTLKKGSDVKDEKIFHMQYHISLHAVCHNLIYCAEEDTTMSSEKKNAFVGDISEFTQSLLSIVNDVESLRNKQDDAYSRADTLSRLSDALIGNPDLRLYIMSCLAEEQEQSENYAEAAITYANAACLVADYLKIVVHSNIFEGASSLIAILPFLKQHISPRDSIPDAAISEISFSNSFTDDGLFNIIRNVISLFEKANMFEYCIKLNQLLIPYLDRAHNYSFLKEIFSNCSSFIEKIAIGDETSTRQFGSYFRVGFYGNPFGKTNGIEYIYRCSKNPHLFEFKEELTRFLCESRGIRNPIVIQDSKTIQKESLNPSDAYVQITSVKPYFDPSELHRRHTPFEKSIDIRRFIYESPFTLDGTNQGDPLKQYIRKTILTVEHSFPYNRSRQVVMSRREQVTTPIEVATESVSRQADRIENTLMLMTSNVNELQSLLQGTLLAQVNTGPMAYCAAFLHTPGSFEFDKVELLRSSLRQLLSALQKGLQVHKTKISHEHNLLQENLEKAISDLFRNMGPYLQATGINSDLAATEEALKSGELAVSEFGSLSQSMAETPSESKIPSTQSPPTETRSSFARRASVNPSLLKSG